MFNKKPTYIEASPEVVAKIKHEAQQEQLVAHTVRELENTRRTVRELEKTVENLRLAVVELQSLATQSAPPMWANAPLHVTDDEEDAKWQLDNNMIDKKMYDEILAEAGLEPNVEIHY